MIACGPITNLDVAVVESLCVPAPFGDLKTMTTKIDPKVRSALECSSQ